MKLDPNYLQAMRQVAERVQEAQGHLAATIGFMIADRPHSALDALENAKIAIDGAMVAAKWATTLRGMDGEQ